MQSSKRKYSLRKIGKGHQSDDEVSESMGPRIFLLIKNAPAGLVSEVGLEASAAVVGVAGAGGFEGDTTAGGGGGGGDVVLSCGGDVAEDAAAGALAASDAGFSDADVWSST